MPQILNFTFQAVNLSHKNLLLNSMKVIETSEKTQNFRKKISEGCSVITLNKVILIMNQIQIHLSQN